jgi:hypothetical protein
VKRSWVNPAAVCIWSRTRSRVCAVDPGFGQVDWNARRGGDRPEEPFQLVIGELEGALVEQRREPLHARLADSLLESFSQRLRVDQVPLVGLVDSPLQPPVRQFGRQVDQGLHNGGNRDAAALDDVRRPQRGPAARPDLGPPVLGLFAGSPRRCALSSFCTP